MRYRNFWTKLISLLLVLLVLGYYQTVAASRAAARAEREAAIAEVEAYNRAIQQEADGAVYQDGTYSGEAMGFGGPITVSVTVAEGKITAIDVLAHYGEDPAYYQRAESVLDAVLAAQSTEVDTVSGATFSSNGLLGAIDQALEQAVK